MEEKIKHLEFIQGVINRLSTNSFLLKGWSVVLVSAMFSLAAYDTNSIYVFLAYVPAISFWGLDGYFVSQERKYRKLYDKVRVLDNGEIDWSMETSEFDDDSKSGWLSSILSSTLILFHGILLLAIIVIMILQF